MEHCACKVPQEMSDDSAIVIEFSKVQAASVCGRRGKTRELPENYLTLVEDLVKQAPQFQVDLPTTMSMHSRCMPQVT